MVICISAAYLLSFADALLLCIPNKVQIACVAIDALCVGKQLEQNLHAAKHACSKPMTCVQS
jgi:hypothetical protein